jgi:hypothetical protein
MIILDYIFYKTYNFFVIYTKQKINDSPEVTSALNVCLANYLLFFSFSLVVGQLFFNYKHTIFDNPVILWSMIIGFGAGHLYYFTKKKRYLKIINKYKNETKAMKRIGSILVVLYYISALAFFIYCFHLGKYPLDPLW